MAPPRHKTIVNLGVRVSNSTTFLNVFGDGEGGQPENCIHEGYILKSVPVYDGMGLKWRKRYCKVFDGMYPSVIVYVVEDENTPDQTIPLDAASIRAISRKKNTGVSFIFEVKNKKYNAQEGHMFAIMPNEGERERQLWILKMKQAGVRRENQIRCQLLKTTNDECTELDLKTEKYGLLPKQEIEQLEKKLQEEENQSVKELEQKYCDLKRKLVDILTERLGEEVRNVGKVKKLLG